MKETKSYYRFTEQFKGNKKALVEKQLDKMFIYHGESVRFADLATDLIFNHDFKARENISTNIYINIGINSSTDKTVKKIKYSLNPRLGVMSCGNNSFFNINKTQYMFCKYIEDFKTSIGKTKTEIMN